MKTILVDAVGTLVIEGQGVFKELYDLLETFPNPKIILSNASDEQMAPFGLANLPYELYTLKHNPNKVDPKYFEKMLKYFGLKSSDVVYFEHDPEAVKSAESLGIKSFYYDPVKKDLAAVKIFLEDNS